MKRLLLPIILVLLGTGGGVGAGFLVAGTRAADDAALASCPELPGVEVPHAADAATEAEAVAAAAEGGASVVPGREYARLSNQFVIPIVTDGGVGALVVMSISLEVEAGQKDRVFEVEPLLRDLFLQVLFDHANTGGFDGIFTATANMRRLRLALYRAVVAAMPELVTDVLIVDIVRQDN